MKPCNPSCTSADSAATKTSPLDWARIAGKEEAVVYSVETHVRRRQRRRVTMVAATAVILVTAGMLWNRPQPAVSTARAIVVRPAQQILPDGSVAELKDGATIELDYGGPSRRVLLRRGEAHFQVTKDPSRAFVVVAGGIEVRAVGTSFVVQLGHERVEIVVTEGTVAVEKVETADAAANQPLAGSRPPSPGLLVDANNRVSVERAASAAIPVQTEVVTEVELSARLAWRVPRLEFNGTPLAEVISNFNQHNRVQLALGDPGLATLPLSGVLRADNIEVLLQILDSSFGLKPDQRRENQIMLRKAQ